MLPHPLHEAALAVARETGDWRAEGVHRANLGGVLCSLGSHALAVDELTAALALSRVVGDQEGECARLGSLGIAHSCLGKSTAAIRFYTAALTLSRRLGLPSSATHFANLNELLLADQRRTHQRQSARSSGSPIHVGAGDAGASPRLEA